MPNERPGGLVGEGSGYVLRFDPSFTTHRKEAALLTEKELMLIDAYRRAVDQAHESIGLLDTGGSYTIRDALAGTGEIAILWRAPIPKSQYDQRTAWAAAQDMLGKIRDLRAIKIVIGLHEQQKLGKI